MANCCCKTKLLLQTVVAKQTELRSNFWATFQKFHLWRIFDNYKFYVSFHNDDILGNILKVLIKWDVVEIGIDENTFKHIFACLITRLIWLVKEVKEVKEETTGEDLKILRRISSSSVSNGDGETEWCRLWKPAIQVRAFVPRHALSATFGVLCHQANWICSTDDLRQQHPLSLVQSPTLRNIPRRQMVCSKDPKTVSSLRKGNDLPRNPVRTHTVWRLFELSANQNLDLPPGLVQHRCLHLNTSWTTPADQFNGDKDSVTQIFGTRHVTPTHADDIICSRKENARAPGDLCEVRPEHHKCKLRRHSDTQSREWAPNSIMYRKPPLLVPRIDREGMIKIPGLGAESLAKDVINFQADLKELREEQKVIAALPGAQPLIGETIKTIEMIPKYFEIAFIVAAILLAFFVLKTIKDCVAPNTNLCPPPCCKNRRNSARVHFNIDADRYGEARSSTLPRSESHISLVVNAGESTKPTAPMVQPEPEQPGGTLPRSYASHYMYPAGYHPVYPGVQDGDHTL